MGKIIFMIADAGYQAPLAEMGYPALHIAAFAEEMLDMAIQNAPTVAIAGFRALLRVAEVALWLVMLPLPDPDGAGKIFIDFPM